MSNIYICLHIFDIPFYKTSLLTEKSLHRYAVVMKPVSAAACVLLLLAAFQSSIPLQAETFKSDQALYSDFLYDFFAHKGLNPERQLLQNALSQDFPYNVIVSVNKGKSEKKLIVAFPQQEAKPMLDDIGAFIQKLSSQQNDFQAEFVFTANDCSPAAATAQKLKESVNQNAGTRTYIDNMNTEENTAVIVIRSAERGRIFPAYRTELIEVVPGGTGEYGRGTVVPRSFFSVIVKAFAAAKTDYYINGHFLSLYRLGLIKAEPLVSEWLSADIPAVLFYINERNGAQALSVVENCIYEYADSQTVHDDTHYSVFRLFNRAVWISEKTYVLFLVASAAVTLFLFFIFSFIRGEHRHIHREEFFRTWFLIPLSTLAAVSLLLCAQFITGAVIGKENGAPLFFLSVKTAFTLCFFIVGFFPLAYYLFKLPPTGFIYGYQLSIAAFLNIFLFACVDIALIPLFITEYIIVYISRTVRKVVPLALCLLFMLVPYMPFIKAVGEFDSELTLRFISGADFLFNLLYAALLLPFLLISIRILIRFKLWKIRGNDAKRKMRVNALYSLFFFVCFFTVCFGIFSFIRSAQKKRETLGGAKTVQSVSLVPERVVQFGRSIMTFTLTSKRPVVRYYIEVTSETVLPILESNYPYDMFAKPFTAVFAPDDYPPQDFMLSFSVEGVKTVLCTVTAYVQTPNGIQTEKLAYTIAGSKR